MFILFTYLWSYIFACQLNSITLHGNKQFKNYLNCSKCKYIDLLSLRGMQIEGFQQNRHIAFVWAHISLKQYVWYRAYIHICVLKYICTHMEIQEYLNNIVPRHTFWSMVIWILNSNSDKVLIALITDLVWR